ncbi:hypothetical protein CW304_17765 [Bacillus sp. UFRGS-B20]|nr:hypothetical protein CW304_17765 [Bacillus sp. UFRGS-B20]
MSHSRILPPLHFLYDCGISILLSLLSLSYRVLQSIYDFYIKHDYKKKILKSFFRKKYMLSNLEKKCYYEKI